MLPELLWECGFTSATGVPCSLMSAIFDHYMARDAFHPASHEGVALALAAGLSAGGHQPVVLLQNSGLGNLVNPLTSLNNPYAIGCLLLISLRGVPAGDDEPQHATMGPATAAILRSVGVIAYRLPAEVDAARAVVSRAAKEVQRGAQVALLVDRRSAQALGMLTSNPPDSPVATGLTRESAVRVLGPLLETSTVISTTGAASRQLFHTGDRDNYFYMQGSMGHATSLAAGLVHRPGINTVTILDGDGSALMHLGALATLADAARRAGTSVVHVIFDNGIYESTGAQKRGHGALAYDAVALAVGYLRSASAEDEATLERALPMARNLPGAALLHLRIAPSNGPLPPRASSALGLPDVWARLRDGATPSHRLQAVGVNA